MKKSLLAFVVALSMGFGQAATVATASSGEEIRAFDFGFKGEPHGNRVAGDYSFLFTNVGPAAFHVIIFVRIARANEGATKKQIIAAIDAADAIIEAGGNPICATCFFDYIAGGAGGPPGTTTPGFASLLPGRYAYLCPVHELDGTAHYELKMFGTFRAR